MTVQRDQFNIVPELACHEVEVEAITREIFGPGMYARAAYQLREGVLPERHLSFVAVEGAQVVGSVRQTRMMIDDEKALLLGPLGVLPKYKNAGLGRRLMKTSMDAARANPGQAILVLLVGDLAYYKQFGFRQVSAEKIEMPRPVEIGRVLACDLREGALANLSGKAKRWR